MYEFENIQEWGKHFRISSKGIGSLVELGGDTLEDLKMFFYEDIVLEEVKRQLSFLDMVKFNKAESLTVGLNKSTTSSTIPVIAKSFPPIRDKPDKSKARLEVEKLTVELQECKQSLQLVNSDNKELDRKVNEIKSNSQLLHTQLRLKEETLQGVLCYASDNSNLDASLVPKFLSGMSVLSAVSLQIGYPTEASVGHSIRQAMHACLAIAVEIKQPLEVPGFPMSLFDDGCVEDNEDDCYRHHAHDLFDY